MGDDRVFNLGVNKGLRPYRYPYPQDTTRNTGKLHCCERTVNENLPLTMTERRVYYRFGESCFHTSRLKGHLWNADMSKKFFPNYSIKE